MRPPPSLKDPILESFLTIPSFCSLKDLLRNFLRVHSAYAAIDAIS